jgi:menaquinone-dependent protoporphyrinogen IX oxidase
MKAIVLYRSLSGFTKRYAEWIAEDLGADLYDCRERGIRPLSDYDLVVHCGSLHRGGINGIEVVKRNLVALAGKRVVVLVVGGSANREGIAEEVLAANFTEEQRMRVRLFYLRGGFDLRKLNMKNRILMALKIRQLRKKEAESLEADERDLLAAYANPADVTDRAGIRPLVDYARS